MTLRVVTSEGRAVAPKVETIAFAFAGAETAATINGKDAAFLEALFALVKLMNRKLDADALKARAGKPGAIDLSQSSKAGNRPTSSIW